MDSPLFEITLEKLTYGGDCMGRLPDGRAVFVPFGLPDEVVKIKLTQEKQNFARGKIVEIISPSPKRVAPKCKHFAQCGGCHYQHLPYETQLLVKADIVRDQLRRIGKVENPPVQPTVASPSEWNYRNHIQFHLTDDGKLGFFRADGDGVLPIEECHLPEASIDNFWRDLQFESRINLERVSLRCGADDDLTLVLESKSPETPELEIEADVSVVHLYENHPVIIAGQDHTFVKIFGKEFKVSADSFFQVNTKMAEKMVERLIAQLPIARQPAALLDLYCGVGLFSKFFADKYQKIIGIESSSSACEDFVFNLNEFENIDLYEGAAEDILPALAPQLIQPLHVILDPPRAGLDKRVLDSILQIKPQVVAYVSCDPSTLARDAARLVRGGYVLRSVAPFDLFPHTYHVESISIFEAPN
ncbi:MAG: class I SAM-dependent RNA methyltransferase [Anaerolineales bacterium]|nr:class I SAM-dependent RNA methyltransferase [Anaerolineales bacterium]